MDSLSQIALGSAVAVAVVGKHSSIKKAALWGAIAGTLPDLDVLLDYGDDLSNMVQHRGFSHSLFYLTLFSPLLALLVCRIHNEMAQYKHWLLGLWLVLITHPLLDTMTIYGTQLALPFSDYPYGVGSIFIIDPLYTLPLLLGITWVLLKGKTMLAANTAGLVLSSCYLLWSVAAQQHITGVVKNQLVEGYDHSTKLLVQPTALNTLLWRVLIRTDEAYYEGFYSLLEKEATVELVRYQQDPLLLEQYALHPDVEKLANFSHGFYALEQQQQQIVLTDLRMGQQQNYAFSFVVADEAAENSLRLPRKLALSATLNWIWLTLKGEAPTELSQSPHNQTSPAAALD